MTLGIDTIAGGTFSTVTRIALIIIITSATIVGLAYYLAYKNPVDFNLSHAISILLLALMATGAGEYAREMLRKPYVIGDWMYSNGTRITYVERMNALGYLAHSLWTWDGDGAAGPSSYSRGEAIFRGECGSCHTMDGYRAMRRLMDGRDRTGIHNFLAMLHDYKPDSPYRKFMPPLAGASRDLDDLTDYLDAKVNPRPSGAQPVLTARR